MLRVLVVRNGRPVAERYFRGGGVDHSNNVHSSSKSMLAALVLLPVLAG